MVSVVSDALEVAPNYARELVASLASSGLIDYETAPPARNDSDNFAATGLADYAAEPCVPTASRTADTVPQCRGVWRIGPSL